MIYFPRNCYQQHSREEVSKREETLHCPLGTEFMKLSPKRILGYIEVETKKVY
jgi:hypothetical protein